MLQLRGYLYMYTNKMAEKNNNMGMARNVENKLKFL